jgi:hypothetical protein
LTNINNFFFKARPFLNFFCWTSIVGRVFMNKIQQKTTIDHMHETNHIHERWHTMNWNYTTRKKLPQMDETDDKNEA